MSTPLQDPARIARRRHEHERQVVIFGILGLSLLLGMLYSVAVFTGAIAAPWLERPFSGAPEVEAAHIPPCLPETPWLPYGPEAVPNTDIHVRILNASGLQGVGNAFQEVLGRRGFEIDAVGNHDAILSHNLLRFGPHEIEEAYVLAGQFESIEMQMDDRPLGSVIDLLPGRNYEQPLDPDDVRVRAGDTLVSVDGCIPFDTIVPDPAPEDVPPPRDIPLGIPGGVATEDGN